MNPFDFFDKIYLINKQGEDERLSNSLAELDKMDLQSRTTIWNCKLVGDYNDPSMHHNIFYDRYLIAIDASKNNYENILILEDDFIFSDDVSTNLTKALEQLPSNWDLLYLGGFPLLVVKYAKIDGVLIECSFDPSLGIPTYDQYINHYNPYEKIGDSLMKITGGEVVMLQSLALNKSMYNRIIKEYEVDRTIPDYNIDTYFVEQTKDPDINAFICIPMVSTAKPGISSRTGEYMPYEQLTNPVYLELLKL